jgi:hypothetical protein
MFVTCVSATCICKCACARECTVPEKYVHLHAFEMCKFLYPLFVCIVMCACMHIHVHTCGCL